MLCRLCGPLGLRFSRQRIHTSGTIANTSRPSTTIAVAPFIERVVTDIPLVACSSSKSRRRTIAARVPPGPGQNRGAKHRNRAVVIFQNGWRRVNSHTKVLRPARSRLCRRRCLLRHRRTADGGQDTNTTTAVIRVNPSRVDRWRIPLITSSGFTTDPTRQATRVPSCQKRYPRRYLRKSARDHGRIDLARRHGHYPSPTVVSEPTACCH
jgi:hypothetical protein